MVRVSEILETIHKSLHKRARVAAHHKCGLIAIDKGAGLLSHPNPKGKEREHVDKLCWLSLPYDFDHEAFVLGDDQLYLCNRLDSATSGVLIVCADEKLAKLVKEKWAQREVTKVYVSVLRGHVSRPSEKWIDKMEQSARKHERGVRMQARLGAGQGAKGLVAKTLVRRVQNTHKEPKLTLVLMQPITGRTHQLRVQSQLRKYPIAGDAKYGDFRFNKALCEKFPELKGRLFLHSYITQIHLEFGGECIEFLAEAPIPESFHTIMRKDSSKEVSRVAQSLLKT